MTSHPIHDEFSRAVRDALGGGDPAPIPVSRGGAS
jgi:hypothetical protein